MKKLIFILFSCILIAALLSGCAGKPATEAKTAEAQAEEDTEKAVENAMEAMETLTNKEWPADKLPSGLPEYTEGEILNSGGNGTELVVKIDKTTEEALKAYLEKLKELGWSVEDDKDPIARKGVDELRFNWQGKELVQMVSYTTELGAWPADKLPPDIFPPENCTFIGGVELMENIPGQAWYTTFTCDGVDEAAAKAYLEKLRSQGWEGDDMLFKHFEWNGKKYSADIELYESNGNISSFTLNLMIEQ